MSEIKRLIRVAASRNAATDYGELRVRLLKSQLAAMREQLEADNMSAAVLIEAVVRGYLERSPAVLAMIDQWRRDNVAADKPQKNLSKRDLDDIYAELGGGILDEQTSS